MSPLAARFWAKVDRRGAEDCWLWQSSVDERGYGRFNVGRKNRKATHIALELNGCPRPLGAVARHHCDTPSCVNPLHLEWGSQAQNNRDKAERGRARAGVVKGEAHANSKVTAAQVRAIRSSALTQRALAAEFGISQGLVSLIRLRKVWRHLP